MIYYNRKTRITASVLGVFLGLGGLLNHGIFEILQGYTSTNGFFIEAIGEYERFWIHGTEAAFTLVHNFFVTGIIVITISLVLILQSISKFWIYSLIAASISWIILMALGIFGYFPGQDDPDVVLDIVYLFLFSAVFFANIAFISGFAKDIEERQFSSNKATNDRV